MKLQNILLLSFVFIAISCIKDKEMPYPVQFESYKILSTTEVKITFSKAIDKRFEKDLSVYYVNNDRDNNLNNSNFDNKYKVKKAVVDGRNLTLTMEKPLEKNKSYFFWFKYLYAKDGGEYPYSDGVEIILKD